MPSPSASTISVWEVNPAVDGVRKLNVDPLGEVAAFLDDDAVNTGRRIPDEELADDVVRSALTDRAQSAAGRRDRGLERRRAHSCRSRAIRSDFVRRIGDDPQRILIRVNPMTADDKPRLRDDLDVVPATVGEQEALVIRDHLGLIEDPVVLRGDVLGVLGLFDGSHTVREIDVAMVRQRGGLLLTRSVAERLVAELDGAFLLDSDRFRDARASLARAFAEQPVREPAFAGASYPADASELRDRLDAVLAEAPVGTGVRPLAVVTPHIDLEVGRKAYAAAYGAVRGVVPRRVVILGTGHRMDRGVFCLTSKDFRTPLGAVETDKEAVDALRRAGGEVVAADDFPHRREHSIEFQVVFLQHVLKGHTFRIVPILCGSLVARPPERPEPSGEPGVKRVLEELRGIVSSPARDVLVVAGVDLSHIGPKFGHDRPAAAIEAESRAHDSALLDALCRRDAGAFRAESRRVEDRFNVCGFSALACLLEVLPECRGNVLHYDVWHEQATRSAVSFAAVVFGCGA
jgi:AmmeMemoRadiSam system protein B